MTRVALQNVSKTFRTKRGQEISALLDVNLEVLHAEFLVLTGPSGAGKSTMLRIIAGLEQPSSGAILLDGQPANDIPAAERDVSMVFQHDALFPHLTIRDNLTLGLRLRKFPKSEISFRLEQIAQTLTLAQYLDRFPKELSGGERQRIALGRALVRHPKVLLLDEPLAHLDPKSRDKLRAEIVRLQRELKIATVYVTHDEIEAPNIADRIAILHGGRLQDIERRGRNL